MNSISSLFGSRYCIGFILLLAVALRLTFFVGFIGDYGEESVYLQDALDVKDGKYFANFDYLKYKNKDAKTDIIETFKFRPLVYFPSGLLMRLFGVSDFTLSLWFIICSVSTVFLTYAVGTALYDRKTGCLASLILAFFPFDIIMSSRINVDQVVSSFFLLTVLIVISCSKDPRVSSYRFRFCLAGIALGMAYLAKIAVLTLLPCLIILIIVRAQKRDIIPFVFGFLIVFSLENLVYYQLTGIPLLHYKTVAGAIEKSVLQDLPMRPLISTNYLVYHAYTLVQYFLKLMLNLLHHPIYPTYDKFFYIWGWLGLAGLLYSFYRKKYIVPFIFLYLYLFSEYGLLTIRWEEGTLHLYQVSKEPRHFLLALPLLAILNAQLFKRLIEQWPKLGFLSICIVLALSINTTRHIYSRYQPTLKDLKSAGGYLAKNHADQKIYVDIFLTDLYLRLFSGDNLPDVERIGERTRFSHNALILVGGTRAFYFPPSRLSDYYCSQVPVLCGGNLEKRIGLPRFSLVKEFRSSNYDKYPDPLRVFRIINRLANPPDPPILDIFTKMLSDGNVELNGFFRHHEDSNDSAMSLYLNGEMLLDKFFFPITIALPRRGKNIIKVIATDSYGSSTVREITVSSLLSEHTNNQ